MAFQSDAESSFTPCLVHSSAIRSISRSPRNTPKSATDSNAKGEVIGPFDLLLAATALVHDVIVVTDNFNEFNRVAGLRLENWQ